MTNSLDPHHPREYRRRAALIGAFGLSGVVLGPAGLIDPALLGTASLGYQLDGPLDELWLLVYALAGLAVFLGVVCLRPEVEYVGLLFLIFAVLVNTTAILVNRGFVAGGVTSASLLFTVGALWLRVGDLRSAAKSDRRMSELSFPGPEKREP